jgi:hypothetical protein
MVPDAGDDSVYRRRPGGSPEGVPPSEGAAPSITARPNEGGQDAPQTAGKMPAVR